MQQRIARPFAALAQMNRVAAATTTPATSAAKQENNKNSLTMLAMMASPVLPTTGCETNGGLLTLPGAKRTPIPWLNRDNTTKELPACPAVRAK
jgi:hypothetical protein